MLQKCYTNIIKSNRMYVLCIMTSKKTWLSIVSYFLVTYYIINSNINFIYKLRDSKRNNTNNKNYFYFCFWKNRFFIFKCLIFLNFKNCYFSVNAQNIFYFSGFFEEMSEEKTFFKQKSVTFKFLLKPLGNATVFMFVCCLTHFNTQNTGHSKVRFLLFIISRQNALSTVLSPLISIDFLPSRCPLNRSHGRTLLTRP